MQEPSPHPQYPAGSAGVIVFLYGSTFRNVGLVQEHSTQIGRLDDICVCLTTLVLFYCLSLPISTDILTCWHVLFSDCITRDYLFGQRGHRSACARQADLDLLW